MEGAAPRSFVRARLLAALAVAAACSLAFLELTGAVLEGSAPELDISISRWMRSWSSPAVDGVMRFFTHVGSYLVTCSVVACIAAWAYSRRAADLAIELVAVTGIAIALNAIQKNTFERPRPDLYPDVVLPETWSFPSGHSMVSLAAYGTAAFVIGRLHPRARPAAWAAVAVVVPLVGASRVYLGVHWPSDVAAGYAAAVVLLLAVRGATRGKRSLRSFSRR